MRTRHDEPIDLYRARRDRQEAGDGTQQRCLAATGTADHAADLAPLERQRQSLEDASATSVVDAEAVDDQQRGGVGLYVHDSASLADQMRLVLICI